MAQSEKCTDKNHYKLVWLAMLCYTLSNLLLMWQCMLKIGLYLGVFLIFNQSPIFDMQDTARALCYC